MLKTMKTKTINNLAVAGIGVLFLAAIFAVSYLYEPKLHLTTPERDAQKLSEIAETVHSESDLRKLEKLAYEYEMAYRHSYNGAKAMYFKSLYEPILIEAGDRRELIRAEEDYLANEQRKFNETLDNIDEAWRMKLGTDEELLAQIAQNETSIVELEEEILELQLRKQQLGEDAWNGPGGSLDEKCLDEIGKIEERITKCNSSIKKYQHNNDIIILACRLQRGAELVAEVVLVEESAEVEL